MGRQKDLKLEMPVSLVTPFNSNSTSMHNVDLSKLIEQVPDG